MRAAILSAAVLGVMALASPSWAAPVALPHGPAAAPAITLVRGGCGPGWHRVWWRGPYGRMHSRCVPNRRW